MWRTIELCSSFLARSNIAWCVACVEQHLFMGRWMGCAIDRWLCHHFRQQTYHHGPRSGSHRKMKSLFLLASIGRTTLSFLMRCSNVPNRLLCKRLVSTSRVTHRISWKTSLQDRSMRLCPCAGEYSEKQHIHPVKSRNSMRYVSVPRRQESS